MGALIEMRASYRVSGRDAEWVRVVDVRPTYGGDEGYPCPVWIVEHADGGRDWWAVDEPDAGYAFRVDGQHVNGESDLPLDAYRRVVVEHGLRGGFGADLPIAVHLR